jgi:hypothetical protein
MRWLILFALAVAAGILFSLAAMMLQQGLGFTEPGGVLSGGQKE